MKKLIHLTIYGRDGRPYPAVGVFIIPTTTRELLERLECTCHILVRFQKPKVFRPDENVYDCVEEADHLEVIPIVWGEAPWCPNKTINGNDRLEGLQDLSEPLDFGEDAVVS